MFTRDCAVRETVAKACSSQWQLIFIAVARGVYVCVWMVKENIYVVTESGHLLHHCYQGIRKPLSFLLQSSIFLPAHYMS